MSGFGDETSPDDLRRRAKTLRQQAADHENTAAEKRADARGLEYRAAQLEAAATRAILKGARAQ